MIRYFILTAILLTGMAVAAQTTTRIYNISLNGKHAGEMKTVAIINGTVRQYSVSYTISGNIIIDYTLSNDMTNRFQQNLLTNASIKRMLNNSVRDDNEITRTATGYTFREKDKQTTYANAIHHTVAELYFKEPTAGVTQVFSEAYLSYLKLQKAGEFCKWKPLRNGGGLTYHYNHGVLVKL